MVPIVDKPLKPMIRYVMSARNTEKGKTMELPKPFGPQYQKNDRGYRNGERACVVCGRIVHRKREGYGLFARVVDGGARFGAVREVVDERGDMGYYPIGSECAKLLPADYKMLMDDWK